MPQMGASLGDFARALGPRRLTDLYLLALGARHGGTCVTFDALVLLDAIRGAGKKHILTL